MFLPYNWMYLSLTIPFSLVNWQRQYLGCINVRVSLSKLLIQIQGSSMMMLVSDMWSISLLLGIYIHNFSQVPKLWDIYVCSCLFGAQGAVTGSILRCSNIILPVARVQVLPLLFFVGVGSHFVGCELLWLIPFKSAECEPLCAIDNISKKLNFKSSRLVVTATASRWMVTFLYVDLLSRETRRILLTYWISQGNSIVRSWGADWSTETKSEAYYKPI